MSALDNLLAQVTQNADVRNLAAKVGLSPQQVESAVAALARSHPEPGDTATGAAAATGLPAAKLTEIINQIGGEGSLGKFASLLDRDGDGNPLNDVAGFARNLLGKR